MIQYLRRIVVFSRQGLRARLAFIVADREEIEGFAVYSGPAAEHTRELQKLQRVLALVRRVDARRFKRIQHDMRKIILSDAPTEYWRYPRVAVLNVRDLREYPEASLAPQFVELGPSRARSGSWARSSAGSASRGSRGGRERNVALSPIGWCWPKSLRRQRLTNAAD